MVRKVLCVGVALVIGVLVASPAGAAPVARRCGAEQSDWVVRGNGYLGDVSVTTGAGEEPSGSHQRYLDLAAFARVAVRTPDIDVFEGPGTFDGERRRIWQRGYRWSVPATRWTPGGEASFLGPRCRPGTTTVTSAIYRFEANASYADSGAVTAWGVLTRDL